jgi:hypothetical protein
MADRDFIAEKFTLPAGRYVLALKNEGYEFTIPGNPSMPGTN